MQFSIRHVRLLGLVMLILAAGTIGGTWLASFATGTSLSVATPPAPRDRLLGGNPQALVANSLAPPAPDAGPTRFDCQGCGPGIRERQAAAERARIDRMLASERRGDSQYGYDRFGNVYYDDGAYDSLAAGLPESGTAAERVPAHADALDLEHGSASVEIGGR